MCPTSKDCKKSYIISQDSGMKKRLKLVGDEIDSTP